MVPDDRLSRHRTRRDLLRGGVGLATAGLTTLTAGCTSALPPLGSTQRFGRIDVPPADPPSYRRWLPAPTEVGFAPSSYRFLFRRPGAADYPAPVRFVVPRKRLLAELDHFGVGYANYDWLLATPFGTVLEADVEPDAVGETLTSSGYTADGTDAGYDRFVRRDVSRRVLVGDGTVVWSSSRVHPRPNVAALLGAREGRIQRYHAVDGAFARLTDAVGESRMVEYVPPNDERTWASCEGFRFDDAAYHLRTFSYPEGERVPEADLRQRSKTGTVLTREVENTDFRRDGRLVTVEGRIPPNEGVHPSDVDPPYPPQITWGYARETDAKTLRIRHDAGEPVRTDALELAFSTDPDGERWPMAERRPLPTSRETLVPGTSVRVDLRDLPDVAVIHPDEFDPEAAEPFADSESRPATRLDVEFAGSSPVFSIDLEADP